MKQYVTCQIEKGKKVEDFTNIFDKKWIENIYYEVRLTKGDKFNNITEIFNEIKLNTLRDKRELSVLPSNKKLYTHGEEVKVTLRIKHINSLQVNIFEIHTANYYE